jgi:glycine oxidase
MAGGELPGRADVAIVGGGLIGCLAAFALARRGVSVVVVERAAFGEDAASRAAAGMLQIEAHASLAMRRLCAASRQRYPALIAELEARSGLNTGYRQSGGLSLAFEEVSRAEVEREIALHREIGIAARWLDTAEARASEPGLAPSLIGAALYDDDAVVDPPRLLDAARRAAEDAGAKIVCGVEVLAIEAAGDRVAGIRTSAGTVAAGGVVLAAGSWSATIPGSGLLAGAVEPMRGQMIEVRLPTPPIDRLVVAPGAYLSPRLDGRVLVGATVERVGFDAAVTAGAAARLLAAAIAAVPALEGARLSAHWCGFRPRTADELPALGPGPLDGLVIATGHFRSGVVLAPITAEIVTALVLGEPSLVDLAPFSPSRL